MHQYKKLSCCTLCHSTPAQDGLEARHSRYTLCAPIKTLAQLGIAQHNTFNSTMSSTAPLSPPECVFKKSSRTSKPAKHADGTRVNALRSIKRKTLRKSRKNEPLLKQVLKKSQRKVWVTVLTSVSLVDPDAQEATAPRLSKKRKHPSTQTPAGPSTKQAEPHPQAPAQPQPQASTRPYQAQPNFEPELTPYDLVLDLAATNSTRGIDALLLADELLRQEETAQECHAETLLTRKFLTKRMKALHRLRDPGPSDAELALLQANLRIVEDGLTRYPRHLLSVAA